MSPLLSGLPFFVVFAMAFFVPHRGHTEVRQTCELWMTTSWDPFSKHTTQKEVLDACDNESFEVLDYQYAKDKDSVFYKPMPNASNMAIVVEWADPETFKPLRSSCESVDAVDKDNLFSMGKIQKGTSQEDFRKFCR
ncbi:MAG: DKNYY domain-containing protein [Rhodospirillales bacterium]|nr:DKNYY domain-containing protein [Rhodospirillales bacterium]